ncbi:hypothetical protein ACFUJ0_06085 [Streptomyces sp. NPDC057242]|uniref:hypothetical protein n=1 Tax=unclassified Streptomyces TaxID=2593676 RepID=UPI0036439BD7
MILTNVRAFASGADLTGASNKIEVSAEVEEKEATVYSSSGWKAVVGSLGAADIEAEGYWEAGDPSLVDDASWAQLGGVWPWTICPDTAQVGSIAYLTRALRSNYKLGGTVGDVAPWSSSAKGSWPLVRGQIAHPPGLARTATGVGSVLNLGSVAAGRRLYAAVHVLSVAGTTPSLTVAVESDDTAGMTSPVPRLTFGAITAPTGQALRTDASAIADTHYRVTWAITGTGPSFMFAVSLGIR